MDILRGTYTHRVEYAGPICRSCGKGGDMADLPLQDGTSVILCVDCLGKAYFKVYSTKYPPKPYDSDEWKPWHAFNEP